MDGRGDADDGIVNPPSPRPPPNPVAALRVGRQVSFTHLMRTLPKTLMACPLPRTYAHERASTLQEAAHRLGSYAVQPTNLSSPAGPESIPRYEIRTMGGLVSPYQSG